MSKIGIITFHDGINYGAFMQAYSLHKAVTELGFDSEFINYKSRRHWLREYIHVLKKDLNIISNFMKLLKFRRLQKKHLPMSAFSFDIRKIASSYDPILFGSDEVWNVKNGFFGFNRTYFGAGISPTITRIAYAPSCGSSEPGDDKFDLVSRELCAFGALSVRDLNSLDIIYAVTKKEVALVPDPTLLVDFEEEAVAPSESDYVLVYSDKLPASEVRRIKRYADERGKKIISIGFTHNWCDESYIDIDPFEWLGFIKEADFVFTTMFHGTLFSLIFNRQMCLLVDTYRTNKFSYMLTYFQLESCIFDEEIDIDYEEFNDKKAGFRAVGLAYLRNSITDVLS
jgi:hypothetical protein